MGTARRERSQVYVSPGRFKKKIQMSWRRKYFEY
jgi:hypothetical protein